MPVTADISLIVTGRHTGTADLGTPVLPFAISTSLPFTSGTGANQVDRVFTDTRTLGASGTEDLDLAAVLVDAFGAAITMAKVKAIVITAAAANTNDVVVSRPASNGVPLFGAASDAISIKPGGFFAIAAPAAAGQAAVTAGTGDLITITNSAGGTPVTYSIVILGTSA
jgi:hypothetical protein